MKIPLYEEKLCGLFDAFEPSFLRISIRGILSGSVSNGSIALK